MRYLVYSESQGIYLGSALGMDFWSNMNPIGQDAAFTFPTEQDASGLVDDYRKRDWATDLRIVAVQPAGNQYATIAECVAVGLPGWDPAA